MWLERCGSDGIRTVTYDFSALKLHEQQEIIDPTILPPCRTRQAWYRVPSTQIPADQWAEVAQRHANGQSLRELAKLYGVSHEAVRQVLKEYGQERG
jgi:hypothetical protein